MNNWLLNKTIEVLESCGRKTIKNSAVKSNKDGDLEKNQKETRKRVNTVLFIERHERLGLFLAILAMCMLNLLNFGLNTLEESLVFKAFVKEGV